MFRFYPFIGLQVSRTIAALIIQFRISGWKAVVRRKKEFWVELISYAPLNTILMTNTNRGLSVSMHSEAWAIFPSSNTRDVGSALTGCTYICVSILFLLSYVRVGALRRGCNLPPKLCRAIYGWLSEWYKYKENFSSLCLIKSIKYLNFEGRDGLEWHDKVNQNPWRSVQQFM